MPDLLIIIVDNRWRVHCCSAPRILFEGKNNAPTAYVYTA